MCKTKFLQMCSFSITFTSLHSLNLPFLNGNLPFHIYYFIIYYFISAATTKFPLDSLHRHADFPIFCISTQTSDQDFTKIVTLVKKRTLSFVTTA